MCMWAIDFFCCFMLVVMILDLVIPVKPLYFSENFWYDRIQIFPIQECWIFIVVGSNSIIAYLKR